MLDLDERLDELRELGTYRRLRMVSGPQGPRVVLDGRPVLLLCSANALGLADHPRVREAAADAAMRWGVGAGAARVASGTMTLHRRLEERLAGFCGARSGLLFGSGSLANLGVIPALARRGEVVFHDELCHASIVDACKLAGADAFAYDHGDPEHLAWGLRQSDGRGALIATEGLFGLDGDVAPITELADLAQRYDVRLLVDESHAIGSLGPGGRGAVAEAGLESEVDVITGSLGLALGAYGGFATCDHVTARYLVNSARTLIHSTAPSPVAIAAAMAALDLLEEQPRRIEKLQANADALRDGLAREGFDTAGAQGHVVSIVVGDSERAQRIVDTAVEQGAFIEAVLPPAVPEGTARLRMAVMASHTRPELREAASSLARACMSNGFRPGEGVPVVAAQSSARVFDGDALPRAA